MTTPFLTGFLDKLAAAQFACVSVRTVERWIRDGLPVYRETPHSKMLVKPADIEAFLQRQQRPQQDLTQIIDEIVDEVMATRNKAVGDRTPQRPKRKGKNDGWPDTNQADSTKKAQGITRTPGL